MLQPRLTGLSIALAAALGAGAAVSQAAEPAVSCDRIVLRERSGAEDGFRVLLGAVSMPGERHLAGPTTATPGRGWRHFRNAGLAVLAGTSSVSVSVPEGWRDRVAVSWGGSPAGRSVRFAPCGGSGPRAWNAYSGGIHLRSRADCVPLVVTVGGTSTTVRVGVGRACGARG